VEHGKSVPVFSAGGARVSVWCSKTEEPQQGIQKCVKTKEDLGGNMEEEKIKKAYVHSRKPLLFLGGQYWVRTSDLFRVKECENGFTGFMHRKGFLPVKRSAVILYVLYFNSYSS
jgi:hypothetical protein